MNGAWPCVPVAIRPLLFFTASSRCILKARTNPPSPLPEGRPGRMLIVNPPAGRRFFGPINRKPQPHPIMKTRSSIILSILFLSLKLASAQSTPALGIQVAGGIPQLTCTGATGAVCQIQYCNELAGTNNWLCLTNLAVMNSPCVISDVGSAGVSGRFYRALVVSPDMASVPAGFFSMGDTFGDLAVDEAPIHTVNVSSFYMDRMEVSKALWDIVGGWATNSGYAFAANAGAGKAANHPVQRVTWFNAVKWCNARSEMGGLGPVYYSDSGLTQVYRSGQTAPFPNWAASGYRLPTEAEWEKAARGGAAAHRFPWTDANTITHSRANYSSSTNFPFDVSPTRGYNPAFTNGVTPYTSPCGYFATNGFGLYDMSGNVWEWCWDWYDMNWYTNAAATQGDTRGPVTGTQRVLRGGSWEANATDNRCANRDAKSPSTPVNETGFRCVREP